jgi:hypothetical protein
MSSVLDLAPPPPFGGVSVVPPPKEVVKEAPVEAPSSTVAASPLFGAATAISVSPHALADRLYEGIAKDSEEAPTAKGQQAFRERVFETCSSTSLVLTNSRIGAHACIALGKYLRAQAAQAAQGAAAAASTAPQKKSVPAAATSTELTITSPSKKPTPQNVVTVGLAAGTPRLVRLDLTGNNLQNYGVFEIVQTVRLLPSLRHLNLGSDFVSVTQCSLTDTWHEF